MIEKAPINALLKYYRDCYRHDGADLNLWQLTKLKQTDRYFLEGQDELGGGFLPRQPIDGQFAEPLTTRIEIYQRERTLLFTSIMVVGKFELFGESRTITSPLVYCQADIECENGDYYASLSAQPQINEALLKLLMPESFKLPNHLLDNPFDGIMWHRVLKESVVELDISGLIEYPKLASHNTVKNAQRRKVASVHSAAMLGFIERSTSSRGVLHEMQGLIDEAQLSAPLNQLFAPNSQKANIKTTNGEYLPGLLSAAQHQILNIAANAPLGLVSGPPGTGKSYTIAAVAAEHMARGESVLIAAHSEAALDVIGHKLNVDFNLDNVTIRAGQKDFLKRLKTFLSDLLKGAAIPQKNADIHKQVKRLKQLNNSLNKLERRFNTFCARALNRGLRLQKWQEGDNQWLESIYLAISKGRIKALSQHWQALEQIEQLLSAKEQLSAQYLKGCKDNNLRTLLQSHRKSLKAFDSAVRSRTSARQFQMFEDIDFEVLLKAFPIWLASLGSLFRVLPLQRELFDLVIIDEASQSNITSALPALYRAKRAIVVGDNQQLRHYSFVSKEIQNQVIRHSGLKGNEPGLLSYRDNSILDLLDQQIDEQRHVAFLDEHFRCKPELIAFSNQHFYQDRLRVMQQRPCSSKGHLHLKRVAGNRDKNGVNAIEADSLLDYLLEQIEFDRQTGKSHSIGILSPYRQQTEYLSELVLSKLSNEQIKNHQIKVATPFGFQGEERDIMLLSFSLDDNARRASVYLNKEDVFNVSITRARQQQIIFLSMDESQLPQEHLLRRYIQSIARYQTSLPVTCEQDHFQQQVMTSLSEIEIESWGGYQLGGLEVDILCRRNNHYLAVDLIGYPGKWQDAFDLSHYKILRRMGIRVLPITWGLWTINPQACIDKIIEVLNRKV